MTRIASEATARSIAIGPEILNVANLDRDGDRLDDLFIENNNASTTTHAGSYTDVVSLEAIFSRPIGASELGAFVRAGGVVRHVFRAVSYGFTGTLPRSALASTAKALAGSGLLLLAAERFYELHLDEATSTGRVRTAWAANFAGSTAGFNGSPTINIAFLDTGVDDTHPDLAGRLVGWKDYTTDAFPTARDVVGHGSHVVGIALGSGVSFGVGPGLLRFTESNDLSTRPPADWWKTSIHLPSSFGVLSSTATWLGGGSTDLSIMRNSDGSTAAYAVASGPTTGTSPLTHVWNGPTLPGTHITPALFQNAAKSIGLFAIASSVTSYPAVGDGFPALRGVAPLSGFYSARVFPAVGLAKSTDIAVAMDEIIALRSALNIKIVNLSFGVVGGIDTNLRAKANTMVNSGIVVVTTAGNGGAAGETADPGRAANAITVGATNDINQLTEYTSAGFTKPTTTSSDEDDKPDILAPGGSVFRSRILSVDANTSDAKTATFADVQANDYASLSGTSMAAPFIAGSAALVIQALEQTGTPWSFASSNSPLLVKALLLASATETNDTRELGVGSPSLGRSTQPKDLFEGYGIVNPDAAIEAVRIAYGGAPFSAGAAADGPADRRAWGSHLTISSGHTIHLSLIVPEAADYDLYLYAPSPGPSGNPILLAASDGVGAQNEKLSYTATNASTAPPYLFVKRISGTGTFTLSGSLSSCGDGNIELGEQCDDSNTIAGDCCSPTCQKEVSAACLQGDAGSDAAASNDAGVIAVDASTTDARADASRGAKGNIDDGTDLIAYDLTEGTVGGGSGCACEIRGAHKTATHKTATHTRTELGAPAITAFLMMLVLRRLLASRRRAGRRPCWASSASPRPRKQPL